MRATGFIILASISSLMGATAADHRPAIAATAQVPLSFEQVTSGNTRWTARGNGYRLAVGAADVEVGLRDEQLRIRFVGANAKAPSVGLDALSGKVNYFIGRDPKLWLRDIPTWERVRYTGVYPGVDMVWYGNQGRLEYDLELQPGADASRIAMRFEGARKMALEASGDLRVEMAGGSLSLKLPEVYQDGSGRRKRIDGRYELRAGNEVGFHLAAYDKSRPLVIDPTLVYATYFGSGIFFYVQAIAVDGPGNVYIGGYTNSALPVVNAVQPGLLGEGNAFISKFDPTGKTLLYSTYLGGSNVDSLNGIAVDSGGSLVGIGDTGSADFPLVNAVQSTYGGSTSAFAFKLNAAGNGLVYSTYLGGSGSGYAEGYAVALDASSNAYFTGYTGYKMQTTPGALNSPGNTFVVKLSNTGGSLYAAVLGADQGNAIAVDAQGAAYVAGYSYQSSFPNNPPGVLTINPGGQSAFVAKLSPDASTLVWATFFGGGGGWLSAPHSANAIALGTGGVVYFGGQTSRADLPVTTGVVQGAYGGNTDAFVASLTADGSQFGFVTYLGGSGFDALTSLAVGSNGLIVAGNTSSGDFPTSAAVQPAFPGQPYSFFRSTDSGASFTGSDKGLPTFQGGAILPDPSVAGVIVLDTGQGVYRSTDDGATWKNVEPTSSGSTARSLSNPSVLYTAGGPVRAFANCDLYQSADGGQTWFVPNGTCSQITAALAVAVAQNAVIVFADALDPGVGTYTGEYRSTDGGQTFTFVRTSLNLNNMVASPDGSVYAAVPNQGLYKSSDAGLTWAQAGNSVLPNNLSGFSVSPSGPSILYASDGNNVYKSPDAGATWKEIGPGAGVSLLAVDPTNPQRIYGIGGNAVLISTDGGATWTPTGTLQDVSAISGLAVNPFNASEVYLTSGDSPQSSQSGFVAKLSTDGTTLLWSTYYGSYGYSSLAGAAPAPSGDVWLAGTAGSGSLPLTPDARNGNPFGSNKVFLARIADATASCTYTVNPGTQYSYSAGQLAFAVTAPSGCAWTATPSSSWIHLMRSSGTGSGPIPLKVDANATASTRSGTVTVNSEVFTIVQPSSGCTYQLSNPTLTSAGGTATITVTAPAGCQWDAELQDADPATVTSATTGTGNGTVTISIPPNSGVDSNSYCVAIGGQSFCIQEASACTYSFPNGTSVTIPADGGYYSTQIQPNLNGCSLSDSTDGNFIIPDVPVTGSGTLSYFVLPNDTGCERTEHITVGNQQLTVTQDFTGAQFNDVAPTATYCEAANLMFSTGVTTGCVQSTDPTTRQFCPNDDVTRQEMAAFLVRAVTGTTNPAIYNQTPYFSDVPATAPFFAHIQKLMELGITTGCSQNPPLYCPTNTIPRWQMAMFMVRARLAPYGAPFTAAATPYFTDVPTNVEGNGMPFPYIQRSKEEYITNGCGSTYYCPDLLVTRGQMASFIMRGLFNETMVLPNGAALLTGVTPNAVAATTGSQITVTITGTNTNFQTGDTVTVPSGMLAVSNVVVNSGTSIGATLTVNAGATAGPQALVVTTGGQNLTLPLAIKVGTY